MACRLCGGATTHAERSSHIIRYGYEIVCPAAEVLLFDDPPSAWEASLGQIGDSSRFVAPELDPLRFG